MKRHKPRKRATARNRATKHPVLRNSRPDMGEFSDDMKEPFVPDQSMDWDDESMNDARPDLQPIKWCNNPMAVVILLIVIVICGIALAWWL